MKLSEKILERARATERRLRASPFWGRLYSGDVTRDEYAGWLVQMHKYARNVVRGERALAAAMAARQDGTGRMLAGMSRRAAEEETGHDDMLLHDLAVLWGTTTDAAWGRVERAETAPAVLLWESFSTNVCARAPEGVIGVALALESMAGLMTDEIRRSLVARSGVPEVERAVAFLAAHSAAVEDGHAGAGVVRADALKTPFERAAASFCADAALALFEGMDHYLSEAFARAGAGSVA